MADGYRLDWKGDEVKLAMQENGGKIISEFALTVEGEAKKELQKGHGVLTGTLRRSIHTVLPGFDWGSDDVEPSGSSPERGGDKVEPEASGGKLTVQVGSGLKYALPVHQGHHSFEGYHYLSHGLDMAKRELATIIRRHMVQK